MKPEKHAKKLPVVAEKDVKEERRSKKRSRAECVKGLRAYRKELGEWLREGLPDRPKLTKAQVRARIELLDDACEHLPAK